MSVLTIVAITPSVGAEVRGADLATQLGDEAVVSVIKQAFLDHHVLVFRDQELTRDQHKDIGRLFGPEACGTAMSRAMRSRRWDRCCC